jgi:NADH-ubiquinone oxidoreductase chain 5
LLSQYNTALFHLTGHAFFKALLFLSAGGIIHSIKDDQDIRKYGGLIKFLPFTYTVIFIGTLSLIAIPFISGFYSKDFILELSYGLYK